MLITLYVKTSIKNEQHWTIITIDLFGLGGLLPHYIQYDDTLENFCFQIFEWSHVYEGIILRWIKQQSSREEHLVCNGKTNCPSEKSLFTNMFKTKIALTYKYCTFILKHSLNRSKKCLSRKQHSRQCCIHYIKANFMCTNIYSWKINFIVVKEQ